MSTAQYAVDLTDVLASIARDSFYEFVRDMWDTISPEKPVWNWHIEEICAELQTASERVFRGERRKHDIICNVPPGTTKSTIFSIMWPAWIWTRMPTARVLGGSHTKELSLNLALYNRNIILSEKYRSYFPDVHLSKDQAAKGYFMNTHGGYRLSRSVGSAVTGFHAHFIIVDDPIDPMGARSEQEIATANLWMTETLPSRKVNSDIALTALVMQRLHQNDPSGKLLKEHPERYLHICLPATSTEYVSPPLWRNYYADGLLDPVRLNPEVLKEKKELGEYVYAGQYLQRPVPLGGGMFKVSRIHIDTPPPPRMFKKMARYWDNAATDGSGDYSVGVLMGIDHRDRNWVLNVKRGQWDTDERERVKMQTAKTDGKAVRIGVEQEPGSAGKDTARATVRRMNGYKIFIERPTGDKTVRAIPYSEQVNGENVYLAEGDWNASYLDELENFPFGTHDDQVDASSGAHRMLTSSGVRVGAGRVKKGRTVRR